MTADPSIVTNLRFTLALAVPAELPLPLDFNSQQNLIENCQRISDTSKLQGYYRVEYSLIPGEPNVGFDIAVFRSAAKIYPDNQESRIVTTWEDEDNNVWITWTYVHQLELTRERLLALLDHIITIKLWDGKEFCSVRTRLDKPRIGRLLIASIAKADADSENTPKHIVQRLAQNYADKWLAKPILYTLRRKLPIDLPQPSSSLQRLIDQIEILPTSIHIQNNILQEKSSDSIVGINQSTDETTPSLQSQKPGILKKQKPSDENQKKLPETPNRIRGLRANKEFEEKREKGAAQMAIPSKLLFSGTRMITCRLDDDLLLPKTIQDCFVSINIDDFQALNDMLAKEFNPLTITLSHVENMPDTPVSFAELRKRCEPAYCCYQLFDQILYRTSNKIQTRHLYWNDLNVYLMNSVSENAMSQFRNSPIVNIELHDRDERESSRRAPGSVFGTETTDDTIGRVSGKMSLLKSKIEPEWHPHGCVKLDLSELWLGQTALEFNIPVVPCQAPDLVAGRPTSAKRLLFNENLPIQRGDYLASGTQMKIIVRLARPLVPPIEPRLLNEQQLSQTAGSAPFTRIVFVFPYNNTTFLTELESCIRTINAKALDFDAFPAHVQVAALSAYKLNESQQMSDTLNIITGFHLFDDEQHLFVLEGRKEDAIDILYQQLPKPEGQNVEILYDSSVSFQERLYVKLGVDLTRIKLHRPLRDIIAQPLIFVRDIVAKETFDALDKLHQLVHVHKMSSSARHHLFPSIDMITSLSREFGVPLSQKEIQLISTTNPSRSTSAMSEKKAVTMINISVHNQVPSSDESSKKPSTIDFLARNIERIRHASSRNKEKQKNNDGLIFMTTGSVYYPYSTQKLNSTENALEQLRSYLKQHHRSSSCSFNPDHRSGNFSPYSNDELTIDFQALLRSRVSPPSGEPSSTDWVNYPGHRSSRQSNVHTRTPDPARLSELSKPPDEWFDKSVDVSREPFKWDSRKTDFDRWTRTPPLTPATSVYWQSSHENPTSRSPSVSDRMHFLRISPQTEMIPRGRLASTQLDRLTGMLKDKPVKKGLLLPKTYARIRAGAQSAPLIHDQPKVHVAGRRVQSTFTRATTTMTFNG